MDLANLVRRAGATLLLAMLCLVTFAQGKTVTGTVVDGTGEPLIGVAITDFDGKFSIPNVKAGSTLVVSYIGYATQEIKVDDQTTFNITLADDAQLLDEVVVIGYGTMSKRDLTGSIASVDAEQLAAVPVNNVSEALTGKMPGVSITTTEGSPDAEVKIRVRGGGSLSQDNSPLYIVDGFPVSSISDIASA